jgi:excinuclease ABC subunit B
MPRDKFELITNMTPAGDQPQAIEAMIKGLGAGQDFCTLLGVTGSGKTFTMANVVAALNRPTLVISHNKTLAAQLFEEFKELFPNNAVEYFVSYYDYYQPEAYIPQRDIYIEKDASRNDDLDRLRLSTTSALTSRRDVLIVASVSCIFGLGSPEDYKRMVVPISLGLQIKRNELLRRLADIQYTRNDYDFKRGTFRVRGDTVEIFPAYEEFAYRVEFFGDDVEAITAIARLTGKTLSSPQQIFIFPAAHYVMPADRIESALASIKAELDQQAMQLRQQGKLLEAQRLLARTNYDMEMIHEVGYCSGIENYARHLAGLEPGARPFTLIDYFPNDYLLFIDESHVTIPQIKAMWLGDRHRKETLVEHGFRLPSALDNRPLRFEEFIERWHQAVFVSATPAEFELQKCDGQVIEQVIRPTGLLDPPISVESAVGQVADLQQRITDRAKVCERVLVTTLTKRLAEDLTDFYRSQGLRVEYLHSEIDTLERVQILRNLRAGAFDALVGVNLLREGLDLPEVSLVAILDADKEGFLRSGTSLIQTIGRTARNVNAEVVLYADKTTASMQRAIDETNRRRSIQEDYNRRHNITPQTIVKEIRHSLEARLEADRIARKAAGIEAGDYQRSELESMLEKEMLEAADNLDFERAAKLRDKLLKLRETPILSDPDLSGASRPAEKLSLSKPKKSRRKTPPSRRPKL